MIDKEQENENIYYSRIPTPQDNERRLKTILIAAAVIGFLLAVLIWALLYHRHEKINEEKRAAIQAFNDSIQAGMWDEEQRGDSIRSAQTTEELRSALSASDFINFWTVDNSVYDPITETYDSRQIKSPVFNSNSRNTLYGKRFRTIHSRVSKVKGKDGEYYPASYEVLERLFKDQGYVRVTIFQGPCPNVKINFPRKEIADDFINSLVALGYERLSNTSGAYTTYKMPAYINGMRDMDYNHKNGNMVVTRPAETEVVIATSGC